MTRRRASAIVLGFGLGLLCLRGAIYYWPTKAAGQGSASAQFNLGVIYYQGQGVPQDYKEAVKWFTKAAEQGAASAQFRLGFMYLEGKGVLEDYKEAMKWFTKAAEQGNADAQILLATHSPIILSQAKAEDVLCFKKTEQGSTDIVSGDEHPQLRDWKGQPNLSVLFASGVLG